MSKLSKDFKVVQIGETDLGDGMYHHVLLASDGECWQVSRQRHEEFPVPWAVGDEVNVGMHAVSQFGDRVVVPKWDEVYAERAMKYDLYKPHEEVAKWWGKDHADRHFLPANPTEEVQQIKSPSKVFTADDFITTMGSSAEGKAIVANQFVHFVENNCRRDLFLEPLFVFFNWQKGCGFEQVDWSIDGFYDHWFKQPATKLVFLQRIAQSQSVDESSNSWADVEKAIKVWVIKHALDRYAQVNKRAEDIKERAELRRLLEKHGLPEDWKE